MSKKILIIISLLLISFLQCKKTSKPSASKGKLDLSSHDFEKNAVVELVGEWEFYWQELFIEKQPQNKNFIIVKVPKTWNKIENPFPPIGYATYRLQVLLPLNMKEVWFRTATLQTAHAIFVNKKLIASSGFPSSNKETNFARISPSLGVVKLEQPEIEILVHISNYENTRGGMQTPILLGTKEGIQKDIFFHSFSDLFLTGGLGFLSFFLFSMYFLRKTDTYILILGITCLALSIRTLCLGERFITSIFPSISYTTHYRILYISYDIAIPTLFHFLHHFFQHRRIQILIKWNYILFFIFFLCQIFLPFHYAALMFIFIVEILPLILIILLLYNYYKYRREIKIYLKPFLFGISIFSFTIFNDMLIQMQVLHSTYLMGYGILVIIFTLSYALNLKLLGDFQRVENLKESLLKLNYHISKFVPFEFINLLKKEDIFQIDLGVETTRDLTILFADIRSFTAISEKMQPHECFAFLNDYFARIAPIIRKHNGFIDKYLGDGIMALFSNKIEDAILAAIEMQKEVEKFNQKSRTPIQIGIGIHKGKTIIGIVGEPERTESTVIGDTVNLASRIESLTKEFNTQILVTLEAFLEVQDLSQFEYRFLSTVQVKGKENLIAVVEILNTYPQEKLDLILSTKYLFEEGLGLLTIGNLDQAKNKLTEVLKLNPSDTAAIYYLNKINRFSLIEKGFIS